MFLVREKESPAGKSKIDWMLVGAALGLILIGSIAIVSSLSGLDSFSRIIQKHIVALVLGIFAFLFGFGFNYQVYQDQSRTLYGITLVLIIAVLFIGANIRGHRSWIRLGFFSLQPSEFARISAVLILANYLDRRANKIESRIMTVLGAFALVAPIMLLIAVEPDFASTVVYFPMLVCMLFCAGANISHLLAIMGFGFIALLLPLVWTFFSLRPDLVESSRAITFFYSISRLNLNLLITIAALFGIAYVAYKILNTMRFPVSLVYCLATAVVLSVGLGSAAVINGRIKEHQRNRFIAFLAPKADPQGVAYNVNQALVAIGSGGIRGKGVFSGGHQQSQLGFLPERHTDFIFAVIGEEMGFIGSMTVLFFYLTLLWRIVAAGRLSRDRYGYLVCCGLASVIAFYFMINVGMCLGIVPVAGIPLPLISYGGSSLVITLWSLGIVSNIYSKRYAFV